MATPTSAWASAGASLVPSPHHGDELALGLLFAVSLPQLLFRCRLSEEVVDAGFGRNRRRGHRIVAGNHDGADAHAAKLGEALADTALHDVFEMNDAEQVPVLGDGKRRAAGFGDASAMALISRAESGLTVGLRAAAGARWTDRLVPPC